MGRSPSVPRLHATRTTFGDLASPVEHDLDIFYREFGLRQEGLRRLRAWAIARGRFRRALPQNVSFPLLRALSCGRRLACDFLLFAFFPFVAF